MTLKHPKFCSSVSLLLTLFRKKKTGEPTEKARGVFERHKMPKQTRKKWTAHGVFDSFREPHKQITKSSTLELEDGYTTMTMPLCRRQPRGLYVK